MSGVNWNKDKLGLVSAIKFENRFAIDSVTCSIKFGKIIQNKSLKITKIITKLNMFDNIINFTEVDNISNSGDFKVDYENNIAYFHESQKGKELWVEGYYYGDYIFQSNTVVTQQDNYGNVRKTLDLDLLDIKNDIIGAKYNIDDIAVTAYSVEEINANENSKNTNILNKSEYKITTNYLKLKSNLSIKGLGQGKTIFTSTNQKNFFKDLTNPLDWNNTFENIELSDFTIDLTANSNSMVAGIHLKGFKNCIIKNVTVCGNKFEGFYLEDCENVMLINCLSIGNKYGFSVCGSCENVIFMNCKAESNLWDGFLNNSASDITYIDCNAENNGYSGIDGTSCGFFLTSGSQDVKLIGCTTKNNGGRAVEFDKTINCKCIGHTSIGDKDGLKIIGEGGFNQNFFDTCKVDCIDTPIIIIASKGNTFSNVNCNTTSGTVAIFEDAVGGSDSNLFDNIHTNGAISTITNTVLTKSKFSNVFLKGEPINVFQSKQLTIYIDFVNGNDINRGITSTTPIKTVARLLQLIEMQGQTVTLKVLGNTFGINANDTQSLFNILGQGKIIVDFSGTTIVNMPSGLIFGSEDVESAITFTFKNATFSPTIAKNFYFYSTKLCFNNIIITGNLNIEALSGSRIVCNNCNITPIMKRDNSSSIVKNRWDSSSIIHVNLIDLSPS